MNVIIAKIIKENVKHNLKFHHRYTVNVMINILEINVRVIKTKLTLQVKVL